MSPAKKKTHPLRAYVDMQAEGRWGRSNPTLIKLAKKTGLSAEALYRVGRGDYNLRNANATKVSKATGGMVTAAQLAGVA